MHLKVCLLRDVKAFKWLFPVLSSLWSYNSSNISLFLFIYFRTISPGSVFFLKFLIPLDINFPLVQLISFFTLSCFSFSPCVLCFLSVRPSFCLQEFRCEVQPSVVRSVGLGHPGSVQRRSWSGDLYGGVLHTPWGLFTEQDFPGHQWQPLPHCLTPRYLPLHTKM